jgi:hypothetical protein
VVAVFNVGSPTALPTSDSRTLRLN